jgi:hypothetical protein
MCGTITIKPSCTVNKISVRQHSIPIGVVKMKTTGHPKCWQGYERPEPPLLCSADGKENGASTLGNNLVPHKKR